MKRDHESFPRLYVRSDGQHDIIVLYPDLVALGYVGTLYQFIAALHRDLEFTYFEPFRGAIGLPCPDLEFPAVEGAPYEFALPRDSVFADTLGLNQSNHCALAKLGPAVGTTVEQREEFSIDVEYADLAA